MQVQIPPILALSLIALLSSPAKCEVIHFNETDWKEIDHAGHIYPSCSHDPTVYTTPLVKQPPNSPISTGAIPPKPDPKAVLVKNSQGVEKWGFGDTSGKLVIPAIYYRDCRSMPPEFNEGLVAVAVGDELHHKYGFIDTSGKWKIKPQYREACEFSCGYAEVRLGESGFNSRDFINNAPYERWYQFSLFLKQYKIIGMRRSAVNSALGRPDKKYDDCDLYILHSGSCSHTYSAVQFATTNHWFQNTEILVGILELVHGYQNELQTT